MSDRENVISLRQQGKSRAEIATALDLTLRQVDAAIETTIVELRDAAPLLIEEMYHVHHARLEALYAKVQARIDKMDVFEADVFKIALAILERQSKLHGLDKAGGERKKTKTGKTHRDPDWMDRATPSELIHEAETYGFSVPEKFKLIGD